MKKILSSFLLTLILGSCYKERCKKVTIMNINGCSNPVQITYTMKDQVVCGSELEKIEKMEKHTWKDFPWMGTGTCRISTTITVY